jgi:hypothetical protein
MPAMDKLNYYVLQTDQMLTLYCKDAEERSDGLLTANTIRAMDCSPSAGLSDELGSDSDKNDGIESMNDDNDGDNSISVQLETQNGNDGDVSDDDEQQVFMLLYIAIISCIMQYSNTRPILLI